MNKRIKKTIKMSIFDRVYEENKKLDDMFNKLYDNYNIETINKNILELLVEIGELANETRCFKYWSNKKPSAKEVILEEYADCFLMILCFCNMKRANLNENFVIENEKDIIKQFQILFHIVSKLDHNLNKELLKSILSNIVNLGYLLNFSNEDIINGCLYKIEKNKERFKTGF